MRGKAQGGLFRVPKNKDGTIRKKRKEHPRRKPGTGKPWFLRECSYLSQQKLEIGIKRQPLFVCRPAWTYYHFLPAGIVAYAKTAGKGAFENANISTKISLFIFIDTRAYLEYNKIQK